MRVLPVRARANLLERCQSSFSSRQCCSDWHCRAFPFRGPGVDGLSIVAEPRPAGLILLQRRSLVDRFVPSCTCAVPMDRDCAQPGEAMKLEKVFGLSSVLCLSVMSLAAQETNQV